MKPSNDTNTFLEINLSMNTYKITEEKKVQNLSDIGYHWMTIETHFINNEHPFNTEKSFISCITDQNR